MASTTSSTGRDEASGSRASHAYQNAREKTAAAYDSTARAVGDAGRSLASNPLGAVAGGFAVGALIGAVLPATRREREALRPVGHKINESARTAAEEAAKKGRDKLNQMTGEVVNSVGSKVVEAVAPKEE